MRELGLEYRLLADLLQKKILKDEFAKQLETEIWHYVKRQKTWWEAKTKFLEWRKECLRTVRKFLTT